jgi:hypothetical protein
MMGTVMYDSGIRRGSDITVVTVALRLPLNAGSAAV